MRSNSTSSAVGQVHDGPGPQDQRLDGLFIGPLDVIEERKLLLLSCFRAQLTAQVAQRQVVQGEAALSGPHQVSSQSGVGGDAVQRPATARKVMDGQLCLVQGFGFRRIGEPGGQRGVVVGRQRRGIDVGTVPIGGGDGQRGGVPVVRHMRAHHGQARAAPIGGVLGQPLRDRAGLQRPTAHVKTLVDLGLDSGQGVEQPVAQNPEFQVVEEPMDLVAIPGLQPQRVRGLRQRHILDQLGEVPVEDHAGHVRPQRVAHLAAHRVDVVDQPLQRAVLDDPFGSGLLPHAGNAGQVVAGVAAQRGEVRVLLGGQPVFFDDRLGGEAGEFADALERVQHRHVVADQLQCVSVAGHHQHPIALVLGLGGQRRDQVVGLEARLGEHGDAQRVEDFLGDVDLAVELIGGR